MERLYRLKPLHSSFLCLFASLLFLHAAGIAQTSSASPTQRTAPYSLTVSVNEVEITFHAADAHNLPVLDLRPTEIDVLDNESGPGQIISMQRIKDRPVRAGLLIDTSASVEPQSVRYRAAAKEAMQDLLVGPDDEGMTVSFAQSRRVVQSWTRQKASLVKSLGTINAGTIGTTSMYDALFSTCLYEFGQVTAENASNVILLFSDGEDTTSHMTMQGAVDSCRRNHTAIYAFSPEPVLGTSSLGASTLRHITEQTGGRLFSLGDCSGDTQADIATVGGDLRNEYLLLYRPRKLDRDGAFHHIVLTGPERVATIVGTSGFYAPTR